MTKTAIIFGGCGFFGTHVARDLNQDPDYGRIVLADIRPPRERLEKTEFVEVDVREAIDIPVFGEVEIFNFAAVHTTPGHADWEYYWTNVRGAIEVCRFADRNGASRIVFTSSMGVYGPQEVQVDDETSPKPVTAYGKSKLLAEKIHEDWQAANPNRKLVVVRPAITFGEGEHGNFTRLARLLRRGMFVFPVRKSTIKACAPIEDFPACLRHMSAMGDNRIRFIYAYPERTTTEMITDAFHQAAGFRKPKIVIPGWVIGCAALFFEGLSRVGLKTSINRARVAKLVQSTNVYPSELVRRGWTFRLSLSEALKRWKQASNFQ